MKWSIKEKKYYRKRSFVPLVTSTKFFIFIHFKKLLDFLTVNLEVKMLNLIIKDNQVSLQGFFGSYYLCLKLPNLLRPFDGYESIFNVKCYVLAHQEYFQASLPSFLSFPHLPSLKKIRHTVYQLSGVSSRSQGYRTCLQVAHQNTLVHGANFIVICHKTLVNTLKS